MTLHPDILTDLITLYHAGEASQASRTLLEEEASRNPQVAAALAATSRIMPPLAANPAPDERKVMRKVRLRYQVMSFGILWTFALLVVALLPRFFDTTAGIAMAINLLPFAVLVLFFVAAAGALYFFLRAVR
jgi:hypothetical protein